MDNKLTNPEAVLNRHICGFHQYILSGGARLAYVSENLCALTGYSADDLISDSEDLYAGIVYPADREIYSDFLFNLREGCSRTPLNTA